MSSIKLLNLMWPKFGSHNRCGGRGQLPAGGGGGWGGGREGGGRPRSTLQYILQNPTQGESIYNDLLLFFFINSFLCWRERERQPLASILFRRVDFSFLFLNLNRNEYCTLIQEFKETADDRSKSFLEKKYTIRFTRPEIYKKKESLSSLFFPLYNIFNRYILPPREEKKYIRNICSLFFEY